jgi:hypothetical protein
VTDDLTPPQRVSLDVLRTLRGACPTAEALVEYEALSESDRTGHPHHAHIITCARCQLALLHMAEPAATRASAMLKWALPLAAVAVLGVALTLVDRRGPTALPPGADTVRGTEIQATAPLGAVEILREFSWQSPIRADRYRVIVRRGTAIVWQSETAAERLAPPPSGTIERDVQYEWQVEALDREGIVRMTSPPQPFVVY